MNEYSLAKVQLCNRGTVLLLYVNPVTSNSAIYFLFDMQRYKEIPTI